MKQLNLQKYAEQFVSTDPTRTGLNGFIATGHHVYACDGHTAVRFKWRAGQSADSFATPTFVIGSIVGRGDAYPDTANKHTPANVVQVWPQAFDWTITMSIAEAEAIREQFHTRAAYACKFMFSVRPNIDAASGSFTYKIEFALPMKTARRGGAVTESPENETRLVGLNCAYLARALGGSQSLKHIIRSGDTDAMVILRGGDHRKPVQVQICTGENQPFDLEGAEVEALIMPMKR